MRTIGALALACLLVPGCVGAGSAVDDDTSVDVGRRDVPTFDTRPDPDDVAGDVAEEVTGDVSEPEDVAQDLIEELDTDQDPRDVSPTDPGDAHDEPEADLPDTNDVVDPFPGATCEQAVDVTEGADFDAETTVGAGDNYEAGLGDEGCPSGSASGPERAYVIRPPEARIYSVRVVPSGSFDPMTYVRADCGRNECVDGTVLGGPGETETLSFAALGGQELYIIVDGELFSEGSYTLDVAWE